MATIDIVIPVYNQAEKIIQCLKSLKQQTFQDFRIFIVNDGSTDNLKQVVEAYLRAQNLATTDSAHELSTKTVILTQENRGSASARNRGAKECTAEFILFSDADIVFNEKFLEKSLATLKQHPEASYCYSSFRFGWKRFKLWHFAADKLRQMPYIHTTALMRRAHFPGFDEQIRRLQDWDLWLTMLEHDHVGVWIPQYLFTVKAGGTMSRWVPKIFVRYVKRNKKVQSYLEAVAAIKHKHGLS